MNKLSYVSPEIHVIKFLSSDVVTASALSIDMLGLADDNSIDSLDISVIK